MIQIVVQITSVGGSIDPNGMFNIALLPSEVPFLGGVSLSTLQDGLPLLVPDNTTGVRVSSTTSPCTNFVDQSIAFITTTTTTEAPPILPPECNTQASFDVISGGLIQYSTCDDTIIQISVIPGAYELNTCVQVDSVIAITAAIGLVTYNNTSCP